MPETAPNPTESQSRSSFSTGEVDFNFQPYVAKNYLLVIAINGYAEDPVQLPPLKNCVKDSEDLIKVLLENYEFEEENVRFLYSLEKQHGDTEEETKAANEAAEKARPYVKLKRGEATEENIFNQFRKLAEEIGEEQKAKPNLKINLIMYYAGHGIYDKFLDQGYWIPVDAKNGDYFRYIPNSIIQSFLSAVKTHHTFMISDSCFSGSLFASGTERAVASSRLEKDASRWGLTAGRNEPVSDGEGENSPFSTALLSELQKEEVATIGVQEICVKVLEKVAANDKQTPRGEPLRVPGHDGGQFIFRKKANANKHFEIGRMLMELAEYRPERATYRSAEKQFALAVRLEAKPEEKGKYAFWQAKALCAAGSPAKAGAVLKENAAALDAMKTAQKSLQRRSTALELTGLVELIQTRNTEQIYLLRAELEPSSQGRNTEPDSRRWQLLELLECMKQDPEMTQQLSETEYESYKGILKNKGKDAVAELNKIAKRLLEVSRPKDTSDPKGPKAKRYALLIGIDQYHHLPKLSACVKDARILGELLENQFSFNAHYYLDATKKEILDAFKQLERERTQQDICVIYYAGNSTLTAEEELILFPVDAQPKDPESGISGKLLNDLIESAHPGMTTLIIDACHAGAMAAHATATGYTLLAGCKADQTAGEMPSGGVFTTALLEVIHEIAGKQEGDELMDVSKELAKRTTVVRDIQEPQFVGMHNFTEDILGKLRFGKPFLRNMMTLFHGEPRPISGMLLEKISNYFQENEGLKIGPEAIWKMAKAYESLNQPEHAATCLSLALDQMETLEEIENDAQSATR